MKRLLAALQFLTILPVSIKSEIKETDFGASLLYFPVVGLLIGILLSLSALALSSLPALVRSAIILIVSIFITGGIHLDGFADTCDGFYGNKPREKILEIMRDSHIGAMGVIGIVSLLILKFSVMASLSGGSLWKILIVMPVFSRWAQALACRMAGYARPEGKGRYFVEYSRDKDIIIGGIFTLALLVLLISLKGLVLFCISFIPVALFFCYLKKRLGGMTGDTIGAVNEVAEACVFLFGLILSGIHA
ncbi:MAG: adenosylcobinamide-GDP ribazoletransferase [Candidatus Omnitrophota bacterium]|nr:adenosylcobinamide-GDP ribazoletransferase [Candidatus Omnitrophota bacterium]